LYAYQQSDQLDDAELCYRLLIKLLPKSAWMRGNYAQFLTRHQRFDEAIDVGEQAIEIVDYQVGRKILATAYSEKGRQSALIGKSEAARPGFERAVELWPDSPYAHYELGQYHADAAREQDPTARAKAIEHYQKALELSSGNAKRRRIAEAAREGLRRVGK
jgi:Tfp pilus assembly protein PilF